MSKTTSIFQKLVFIVGVFNFPIGIGLIAQALMASNPEVMPIQIAAGAFIFFAGPALMWASRNLQTRAPIVTWNGMVRLCGFLGALYTYTIGGLPTALLAIAASDLILGFIFVIGSSKDTGIPVGKLLLGKSETDIK